MTELQRLELRVLQLVGSIDLRPTLDRAAALGEVLAQVKGMLEHGHWLPWLKRVKLNDRSARNYMTVFRETANRQLPANMTIERFLSCLRDSRIGGKKAEREQARELVAARLGTLSDAIRLTRADCRAFDWPTLDAIVTDPPWADLGCYRWLATMAAEKLREGGVLLLQCGTGFLADVLRIVTDAGLVYNWTLAFGFAEARRAKPTAGRWLSAWSPVLVFSKGVLRLTDAVGDFYLIHNARDLKTLHDWAQPEKPYEYWLKVLIPPGSLVADPFTGSGTTAAVCQRVALRFVGTEIDPKAYAVAVGRLRSPPPA